MVMRLVRHPVVKHGRSPRESVFGGRIRFRRARTPFRRLTLHSWRLPLSFTLKPSTHPHSMSKKKRRVENRKSAATKASMTLQVHPDAAGIDIGATELVAAVSPDRGGEGGAVRSFSSFTSGVHALRDWLLECGVKTAALESTGNYWITTYAVLEDAGIEVWLVNARHVKGVPGRKTDVQDAQWLQQLHSAGLLRKSFRPAKDILPLRYLTRHRTELVAESVRQVHLMQKVLTEMNLHIHHVFSDVDGLSAQNIIEAILGGERDPEVLAGLRDARCRSPKAKILAALEGDYREEYLFVLRQCQQRWRQIAASLAECDAQIEQLAARVQGHNQDAGPLPPPAKSGQHRVQKNSPGSSVFEQAWRFYGVDLSEVPGVGSSVLSVLMSELGTGGDVRRSFRSGEAFCSWLGLCPDNRISGGRVLKAKTRKVASRVSAALRLAAQAVSRSEHKLGEYVRRMKGRLGKAEGITAAAHKLARILYHLITTRNSYDENQAFKLTPSAKTRRLNNLQKSAQKLGFTLVPQT